MGRLVYTYWPLALPNALVIAGFVTAALIGGETGITIATLDAFVVGLPCLFVWLASFDKPYSFEAEDARFWYLGSRRIRADRGSVLRWGTKGTLAEPDGDKVRVCGYERGGPALWPFAAGKIAETYLGSFDAIEQAEAAYEVTAGFMQDRELSASSDALALAKALTR